MLIIHAFSRFGNRIFPINPAFFASKYHIHDIYPIDENEKREYNVTCAM